MENMQETTVEFNKKMRLSHLKPHTFTQEEREAAAAKVVAQQEWAKEHLKLDWMDENWLREIAHNANVKLARYYFPSSETKYLRRTLKTIGKDSVWHKEVFGYGIGDWINANPRVPVWVAQCLIVEQHLLEKTLA